MRIHAWRRSSLPSALLATIAVTGLPLPSSAAPDGAQQLALAAQFADKVCGQAENSGISWGVQGEVDAQAKTKALANLVAGFTAKGALKGEYKSWKGPNQADIAQELKSARDCRSGMARAALASLGRGSGVAKHTKTSASLTIEDMKEHVGCIAMRTDHYDVAGPLQYYLNEAREILKNKENIFIIGYVQDDKEGTTREYALALGGRRANAAKDFLLKYGLPADRIETTSVGREGMKEVSEHGNGTASAEWINGEYFCGARLVTENARREYLP